MAAFAAGSVLPTTETWRALYGGPKFTVPSGSTTYRPLIGAIGKALDTWITRASSGATR